MIPGFGTLQELFDYACKSDPHAVRFCESVWMAAHLWDDLKDGGEPHDVDATFAGITSELLINPFVTAHSQACAGIMALIIANWQTANAFEAARENLPKAYMLRAQLYNLPVMCAFLLHGQVWADHVSKISWQTYGEILGDFMKEVHHA